MKRIIYIISMFAMIGQLVGQELKTTALQHFNNQEWKEAAKNYSKYLKKNNGDSSDWYNLAFSKTQLSQYTDAIKYYKEARKRNYPAPFIVIGLSKAYALSNDQQSMFATLEEGAKNGLGAYKLLKTDPVFSQYQNSPEFVNILNKVELNAYPCLGNQNYRHFDFWLGEWDVMVNGRKVGDNSITMPTGGCAIHENYTTAGNYAGQSINFYDPIDKKWHQHWVGSGGDVYNYLETKREEGLLQFESKFMNPNGNISLSRLTFTLNPDGTVRQLFENSNDNGKTWTPAFDGLYVRKK